MLRDIVRNISNGNKYLQGLTVGVVDERCEIAAMYKGVPQNDIGLRTDILSNIPKAIGMRMLIRSMAPQVIVADEIGNTNDIISIEEAMCLGVKGIFTAHGADLQELEINKNIKQLLNSAIFEKIIFLEPKGKRGEIQKIYSLNKENLKYE